MADLRRPQHTQLSRDRSRALLLGGAAVLTCGALGATGALAGLLVEPATQDAGTTTTPASPTPVPSVSAGSAGGSSSTAAPTRTVVSVRTVTAAAQPELGRVGGGDALPARAPTPQRTPARAPAPARQPQPAAPAPAPVDTPSSGS